MQSEKLINIMVRILRTMTHPDWALKHKIKGTELRKIGKYYYLYKISHIWDKEKKQSKKITGEYLGKITEEGIFKKNDQLNNIENTTIKEFGASKFISTAQDIIQTHHSKMSNFRYLLTVLLLA